MSMSTSSVVVVGAAGVGSRHHYLLLLLLMLLEGGDAHRISPLGDDTRGQNRVHRRSVLLEENCSSTSYFTFFLSSSNVSAFIIHYSITWCIYRQLARINVLLHRRTSREIHML